LLLRVAIQLPLDRGKFQADPPEAVFWVATFCRVRSGLPLPSLSLGVALVTVGVLAGVAMSTGVVPVPGPTDAAPAEPEITNIGGDQPPMEFTPMSSAVKVVPVPSSGRPVPTSPPPHSNPVVTPDVVTPRMSVVVTTVVPSVSLPALPSSSEPVASSSATGEGVPGS
jgi:hypothetical protein